MANKSPICEPIAFLPDGRPCPAIMTAEEVARLLRLDGDHPERCLKYWRDQHELKGIILGKKVRYRLQDILDFLATKAAKT